MGAVGGKMSRIVMVARFESLEAASAPEYSTTLRTEYSYVAPGLTWESSYVSDWLSPILTKSGRRRLFPLLAPLVTVAKGPGSSAEDAFSK